MSSGRGVNVDEEIRVNTQETGGRKEQWDRSRNSFMSLISVSTTADMPAGENWQEQLGHTHTKNSWDLVNTLRFPGVHQLARAFNIWREKPRALFYFLKTSQKQRTNKGHRLGCNMSLDYILLELQLLTSTERKLASKLTFSSRMLQLDAVNYN